jgi:hypothetical protein
MNSETVVLRVKLERSDFDALAASFGSRGRALGAVRQEFRRFVWSLVDAQSNRTRSKSA